MKRVLDLCLATATLILLSPVFLLVALAIYWGDGFPIFFRQVRVGKDLRRFTLLKFRTMKTGSFAGDVPEGATPEMVKALREKYVPTDSSDRRVTPIGKILRKTSLDELPQLLNVIQGEMSLVGPRPMVPAQEFDWDLAYWRGRHSVKPGITGLAQINGRSSISQEKLIECDLRYAKSAGFFSDIKILFLTLGEIAQMRGRA